MIIIIRIKGEVHPITCHESKEGLETLDGAGGGGERHVLAALPSGMTRCMLYRRQVRTGANNLAPTGNRSPDSPANSQSLYTLSYPNNNNNIRVGTAATLAPRPSPVFNPLNAELSPICHLLALLAHHIFHVSGLRINPTLCFKCQ